LVPVGSFLSFIYTFPSQMRISFSSLRPADSVTLESSPTANSPPHTPQTGEETGPSRRLSRAVALRAILFVTALLLTFSLDTILILYHIVTGSDIHDVVTVVAYVLFPLEGVFNFLIFCWHTSSLKTTEGRFLYKLLSSCWVCRRPRPPENEPPVLHVTTEHMNVPAEEGRDDTSQMDVTTEHMCVPAEEGRDDTSQMEEGERAPVPPCAVVPCAAQQLAAEFFSEGVDSFIRAIPPL
jgi:hypothetical protein